MTTAANLNTVVGYQFAGNVNNNTNGGLAVEVATSASGYIPQIAVGTILTINDPYWGGQELIRVAIPANTTAINVGTLANIDASGNYVINPITANTGQSVFVSMSFVPNNPLLPQYAWFIASGRCPVLSTASVAANTELGASGVTAGRAAASAAGLQLLNARVRAAATATVVKANTSTQSGSNILRVPNTDGWFVGVALSGTGIAASTTVTGINEDNRTVTMNNNATATGAVSVTGTYNDGTLFWNTVFMDRPFVQGRIT